MAKFVFGMNQSLDGYIDHTSFSPPPSLFRHFIAQTAGLAGSIYGRTMYEVMRYWDDEQDDWGPEEREFAKAWCAQPKWVVSRTMTAVGPNATLISDNVEATLRRLKAELQGDVDIAGTILAKSVGDFGLLDEYRIYLHPVVVGSGKPFFAGPRPPLKLTSHERVDGDVLRLTYAPA